MEDSHISWTDNTFNPLEGCEKVSLGCMNCYAEARDKRFHDGNHWGPNSPRLAHTEAYWRQPVRWNLRAVATGERERVFCASLSDWLEDHPAWLVTRPRLLHLINATPNLDWLLLSKRVENWASLMEWHAETMVGEDYEFPWLREWFGGKPVSNIRVGTTMENQAMADKRIIPLLKIPGENFVSMEPLLEGVILQGDGEWGNRDAMCHRSYLRNTVTRERRIDWVIVGGESGPNARPMALEWAMDLREQCRAAGVPFHFKQMGARPTLNGKPYKISDDKGGIWEEMPEELRVRELPEVAR